MTNLVEFDKWEDGVYQLETSDPVQGGPEGIDNLQAKQLANRTRYLKKQVEAGQSNLDVHTKALDPHPQYATKADLAQKLADLVDQSPEALNTLKELANAMGNDPNFATTAMNEVAKKAPIDSPTFTGTPKVPMPPQFDSSEKAASTAFVQRALGNMQAGGRIQSAANAVFSASKAGGSYSLEVSSTTYTLPSLASVQPGATFEFVATVNAATISTSGADKIMTGSLVSATTCILNNGDTARFVSDGAFWVLVGGSAALRLSLGDFGSSLATNGYQKLPNGLIMQWGYASATVGSMSNGWVQNNVVWTFPIAFPNTCFACTGIVTQGGSTSQWSGAGVWISGFTKTAASGAVMTAYQPTSGPVAMFIAIGS
ncbi:hypothetical protein [Burkholderia stagnalis]|uniref:gp53-like domain-containing protein n=1 Tax=Burkholderia stagnalis TaxID=1503054 RepID=UPI000AB8894A|nr:hypothetical protein [Burkholderia stagnalis]